MLIKFFSEHFFICKNHFYLTLFFFLQIYGISNSQTLTNLEVFYSLTDSLVDQIIEEIPFNEKEILLTLNLGETYSLFANQIRTRFDKHGKKILDQPPDEKNVPHVDLVIEGAGVEYGGIFRDGWFDTHFMPRYSTIFGNYLQSFSDKGKENFEISIIDTIKVDDVKYLENESFPFTQGNIPPEPFLSGIAEPLIAITVAAAIIILFFSVRSK